MRSFVGRENELRQFRAELAEPSDGVTVVAFHGPGGVGKTFLLRRFAIEATRLGRDVVEVDGESVGATEEALAAEVAAVRGGRRVVLLVDGVEHLCGLERWFRERFLLSLGPGSLVVLAGRQPPRLSWRSDPVWQDSLTVRRLGGLTRAESARVLAHAMRGRHTGRGTRAALADGHPLALRLLGADDGTESTGGWRPSPMVLGELVRSVAGPTPSDAHRRALEICAHVPDATEDLLRVFMPDQAYEVFDWLRRQPFVTTGHAGLRLLPVVARAVDQDLRWRAPDSYLAMHKQVRAHVQSLATSRPEPESLGAAAAFNHVLAQGRWVLGFDWTDSFDRVYETPCDAQGIRSVQTLARSLPGIAPPAMVDYWLHRQPEGFHLYRSTATGRVVGCLALLRFARWDAAEVVIDPVVGAVRDHIEGETGLHQGQQAQFARFMLIHGRRMERASVRARMLARITREILSQRRLDWTFLNTNGDEQLGRLMEFAEFRPLTVRVPSACPGVTLCGHDWRAMGVTAWADLLDDRMLSGLPATSGGNPVRTTILSRTAFDEAVHHALKAWHDRARLATNPLLHATFVTHGSSGPEQVLRKLIVSAVEAIDEDPKARGQRAAVWATYLEGGTTQQAVARELSLSFSTYRRYLKRGVERVCWYLWEQEMTQLARFRSGAPWPNATERTEPVSGADGAPIGRG